MELDKILIGIVLISICSIGIGSLFVDLANRYDISTTPEYMTQFNRLNETYALTQDLSNDIKGASVEAGADASSDWDIGATVKAGLNAVKVVFVQGIPTIFATITGIGETLPLPEYIIRGIQAIMLISVTFALVYLYFRYKNG